MDSRKQGSTHARPEARRAPLRLLNVLAIVTLGFVAMPSWLIAPRFLNQAVTCNIATTKTQIGSFKQAIDLYVLDVGRPPTTAEGLDALIHRPAVVGPVKWQGPYLTDISAIPVDQWGRPYHYQCPGPGGEDYLIFSYGENGKPGGDGWAADVSSADVN